MYYIDEATEDMRIAYPIDLFDRNVTDGRMMLVSFLTLAIGNNQGMGDVEYAKMHDIYIPPTFLALFDGPAMNVPKRGPSNSIREYASRMLFTIWSAGTSR